MPLLSSTLLLRTHSLTFLTFAYYLVTSPAQLLSSTPIWLLGESMSLRPASYAPEPQPHDSPSSSSSSSKSSTSNRLSSLITGHGTATVHAERELCALLAVILVGYAVTIFLFAGDLTLPSTAAPPASSRGGGGKASSGSGASVTTVAASSSRYGEQVHTLLTAQSRWLSLAGLHVLGSSGLVAWIYLFHSQAHHYSPATTGQSLPSSSLSGFGLLANRVTFTAALVDMLFWGYLWTVLKDEGREVAKALARRREFEDDGDE
ncbi:hypothetical protein G647_10011 [Cladophialophora carrionii CBS 160.54]|uniref:Uncharacterized protein n=1 Tax=Cladophialophora carrionii CBS 160.54 TaxID=1279043 RepID=V9DLU3_9EURO|nr:uncharacterized protein G647_10011 [Cladophialophora carrionii CBS 160.54]ETI26912.1 hypothetical protein G647_10011 [Cladophialophora carrionii CBS 160.54]